MTDYTQEGKNEHMDEAFWWVDEVASVARGRGLQSERPLADEIEPKHETIEYEVTDFPKATFVLEDGAWVRKYDE